MGNFSQVKLILQNLIKSAPRKESSPRLATGSADPHPALDSSLVEVGVGRDDVVSHRQVDDRVAQEFEALVGLAVVLGREGNDAVGAWQLARAADTVPWEILCGIGERVRRVYSE